MNTETRLFLQNLDTLEALDSSYLKAQIFSVFREFLAKDKIIWFYVDTLPESLNQLSTSVVRYGKHRVILLLNSELKVISKFTKQPLNFVANTALIHEISHIIAGGFGRFDDEKFVWEIGERIAVNNNLPEYCYQKIKNYIQRNNLWN